MTDHGIDSQQGRGSRRGAPRSASLVVLLASLAAVGLPVPADAASSSRAAQAGDWLAARLRAANGTAQLRIGSAIGRDPTRLEVRVPPLAERTAPQQELIDRAIARFGDLIELRVRAQRARPAACSYPYCDPPLRAGIRIIQPGESCSGGFLARSRSDSKLYQFTAGHCNVTPTTNWSTRFVDGSSHVIGPIHRSVFGSAGDASIIRVNNPTGWRARAWVLVTAGSDTTANSEYPIKAVRDSSVGMRICITGGWFGGSNCGSVTAVDVTVDYGDAVVTGLVESSVCAAPGDSGAPLYARNTAYGVLSGIADTCVSLYQPAKSAEDLLNVNISRDAG